MTAAVLAPVTCPRCGGPVEWLADGAATLTRAVAMLRCPACPSHPREFRIEVRLVDCRDEGS